jgi:U2-associated protein SR140
MSDPTNQLPWGIESKQLQPGSMKTITDSKLATFAIGQTKKSRFQKAREEKEQKKKLEDEEAARVYNSFVASFDVDESSKTFIRGGKADNEGSVLGGMRGDVYKLEPRQKKASTEMERMLEEMKVNFMRIW